MPETQTSIGQRLLWWGVYLLGWVGSSALALWLILQMRINLIDLNNFLGWGPWLLIAVDKFGLLILGLGWLIGVFVLDIYLRAALTLRLLFYRVLRVFLVVLALLGLSYFLQWLLI